MHELPQTQGIHMEKSQRARGKESSHCDRCETSLGAVCETVCKAVSTKTVVSTQLIEMENLKINMKERFKKKAILAETWACFLFNYNWWGIFEGPRGWVIAIEGSKLVSLSHHLAEELMIRYRHGAPSPHPQCYNLLLAVLVCDHSNPSVVPRMSGNNGRLQKGTEWIEVIYQQMERCY